MRAIIGCLVSVYGLVALGGEPNWYTSDFYAAYLHRIVYISGSSHLRESNFGIEIMYASHGDGSRAVSFSLPSARAPHRTVTYDDMDNNGQVDAMHGDPDSHAAMMPLSEAACCFIFRGNEIIPVQKSRAWARYPTGLDGILYRRSKGSWVKTGVSSQTVLRIAPRDTNQKASPSTDHKRGRSDKTESLPKIPQWVNVASNRWHFFRPISETPWSVDHDRDSDGVRSVTLRRDNASLQLACSENGRAFTLKIGEDLALNAWYKQGHPKAAALRYEVKIRNRLYEDLDGDGIIDLISETDTEPCTIRVGCLLVPD